MTECHIEPPILMIETGDPFKILSKIATSQKIHVIFTKYFMCTNWGHNVIYLQNIKFEKLIIWPGGAYTDATHGTKCKIFVKFLKTFIIFFYINHINYSLTINSPGLGI